MTSFSLHKCALATACLATATTAQAGFNEGDAIVNTKEFLVVSAFGLAGAPLGFVVARLGLTLLYRIVAWFLVLCVLALGVATVLLAGDLGMILVVFAAMLIVPGFVFYLLGGWAGFALRARGAGKTV